MSNVAGAQASPTTTQGLGVGFPVRIPEGRLRLLSLTTPLSPIFPTLTGDSHGKRTKDARRTVS